MIVIGLTGGIGSGKSTVAAALGELGATVIDVDAIGRDVIAPGGRAAAAVIGEFGAAILDEDGAIDRLALAEVVFADTERLEALEAISHPAINAELETLLDAAEQPVVVFDMAVLAESNLGQLSSGRGYQTVVVVEAPESQRMERLVARGLDAASARARMEAQASDADRRLIADHVIVNDGTIADLQVKVQALWKQLSRSQRG